MRLPLISVLALTASLGFSAACAASPDGDGVAVAPTTSATSSSFDLMMDDLAAAVDGRLAVGIPVPVPVDAGGGYTHEQHKQNAKTIYEAGMQSQQTGETK